MPEQITPSRKTLHEAGELPRRARGPPPPGTGLRQDIDTPAGRRWHGFRRQGVCQTQHPVVLHVPADSRGSLQDIQGEPGPPRRASVGKAHCRHLDEARTDPLQMAFWDRPGSHSTDVGNSSGHPCLVGRGSAMVIEQAPKDPLLGQGEPVARLPHTDATHGVRHPLLMGGGLSRCPSSCTGGHTGTVPSLGRAPSARYPGNVTWCQELHLAAWCAAVAPRHATWPAHF